MAFFNIDLTLFCNLDTFSIVESFEQQLVIMEKVNRSISILGFLILIALSFSCGSIRSRVGYKKVNSDTANYYCHVSFWRSIDFHDTAAVELGSAKYKGKVFRSHCSEVDAMDKLQDEACSIGANVVVIISDKRPDFFHGCFRCSAFFYKSSNLKFRVNSEYYSSANLKIRMQKDKGVSAEPNIGFQASTKNY